MFIHIFLCYQDQDSQGFELKMKNKIVVNDNLDIIYNAQMKQTENQM